LSKVLAQVPAIPKAFVHFNQLDLICFAKRQLICTSRIEVICGQSAPTSIHDK
jgi:hypothetical protein